MWYVVQVRTGTEENIRIQCERRIPRELLTDCFIPYYEEPKKVDGQWIKQRRMLFPGYVFVVTDDVSGLYLQLKVVSGLTKLIGAGRDIIALTDSERAFIESFGGDEKVMEMRRSWRCQPALSKAIASSSSPGRSWGGKGVLRK